MKPCIHHEELCSAMRAGHWPEAASAELRDHVATCSRCAEEARLLTAFRAARSTAMRTLAPQSPALLWWKAQLRQRHRTMEQLQRPAAVLSAATIGASLILLIAVLVVAWHQTTSTLLADWRLWIAIPAAAAVVLIGLRLAEERH